MRAKIESRLGETQSGLMSLPNSRGEADKRTDHHPDHSSSAATATDPALRYVEDPYDGIDDIVAYCTGATADTDINLQPARQVVPSAPAEAPAQEPDVSFLYAAVQRENKVAVPAFVDDQYDTEV